MAAPSSIFPTGLFDELDFFLLELEQHDKLVEAGVAVQGPGAAYALVWEWGNIRQTKPGPKTVLGTNPDGTMIWLSAQAPFGYIRVNEDQYWEVVKEELGKMKFKSSNPAAMTKELEKTAWDISKKMAEIVKMSVPVDSGDLQSGIYPVKPNDVILEMQPGEGQEYQTLTMDEEE